MKTTTTEGQVVEQLNAEQLHERLGIKGIPQQSLSKLQAAGGWFMRQNWFTRMSVLALALWISVFCNNVFFGEYNPGLRPGIANTNYTGVKGFWHRGWVYVASCFGSWNPQPEGWRFLGGRDWLGNKVEGYSVAGEHFSRIAKPGNKFVKAN